MAGGVDRRVSSCRLLLLALAACAVLPLTSPCAQWAGIRQFGKNKVSYQDFDWQFVETKHFKVYYSQGEEELAHVSAEFAEDAYRQVSRTLQYDISAQIPILVYDSHNDFEQTNATFGLIDQGTAGFTEVFKNRMVLPFTGSYTQFRHVMHHELTHAVMFDMFYLREGGVSMAQRFWWAPPLWFVEGLAEYCSNTWSTEKDMWVRMGVINGYLSLDGF